MNLQKAHIKTFGCQMNEHDSFRMMDILRELGYELFTKTFRTGLFGDGRERWEGKAGA